MTRKVVFFTPYEHPGGLTARNFDFAVRLVQAGWDVTLVTNNFCHRTHRRFVAQKTEVFEQTEHQGVTVAWLNTRPYYDNGVQRALNAISFLTRGRAYVQRNNGPVDFVIADSVPPTAGLLARYAARKWGAQFIYQVRDVWPIALVHDGAIRKYGPIYAVMRIMEVSFYRRAYRVCSTLRHVGNHVQEAGADPNKVIWIPNGIDLAKIPFVPRVRERGAPIVIGYAGGFGNAHDVVGVVKAALILKKRGVSCRFKMYGNGVKRLACEKIAVENGINTITFHDAVPRDELPRILSDMDIFVAAVTDSDAYRFGLNLNKIYDYFAVGRPVVFSGRTEDDPVLSAGCGRTVEPENSEALADAFEELTQMSDAERNALGERARRYAEANFDVDELAQKFKAMLL